MHAEARHKFDTPRYTYRAVEGALATVFGIDAKTKRGPLRGRLKHIQRLGLPGTAPGKGARVSYSLEQVFQWLIALLLSEIGIDPIVIVKTIKKNWKSGLAKSVQDAADAEALSGIPILLSIRPLSMSGAWINKKSPTFRTLPWIIAYRRPEHHHYLQAVGITVSPPHMEGPQELKTPAMGVHQEQSHSVTAEHEWLCTCNLTDAVRKLKAALQPEK